MIKSFLILAFLFSSLSLAAVQPDVNAAKFEAREKKKHRVDTFDFNETYPNLEQIDIDGKRKKCVELSLTGEFPVLEKINYEGFFGEIKGKLTGSFPKLKQIDFLCKNCALDLDFQGKWEKSCEINICSAKENINLKLPKDVGILLNTKVGVKGKVIAEGYKKQGKFGIFNKKYKNELADTAEVVLTLNIETVEGIILIE